MDRIIIEHTIYDTKAIEKLSFENDTALFASQRQQSQVISLNRTICRRCVEDQTQIITTLQNIRILVEQKNVSNIISDNDADIQKRFSNYVKGKQYSEKTINHHVDCTRIFLNFHNPKHFHIIFSPRNVTKNLDQ